MYEELVKRLKEPCQYENCVMCNEATYAIEELSKRVEKLEAAQEISPEAQHFVDAKADSIIDGLQELLASVKEQPRWIPVTERLPETRDSILGQKSSKVVVAFRFDDGTQGTDTAHTLNGEWVFEDHIIVVRRTVTHWMPLPEPPKEE